MSSDAGTGYLAVAAEEDPVVQEFLRSRADASGFVMNAARVWARLPAQHDTLFQLLDQLAHVAGLSFRRRGILVTACATQISDSYCALAWGHRLAADSGEQTAISVIRGTDETLEEGERALAAWARKVAKDPNGTDADDVEPLRAAGYDDTQILAITVFVALRMAYATVNDALGSRPDERYDDGSAVTAAVTFGRRIANCH